MVAYTLRRLLLMLPILLVVAVVAFFVTNLMPGDPVRLIAGDFATEAQVAELTRKLGFDQPLHLRFWAWLSRLVRGDLGDSLFLGQPVTQVILSRIEPTLLLAFFGQTLGVLLGVPLGILSAAAHRTWVDQSAILITLLGLSIPSFWLATMLIMVFGVRLGWLPIAGYEPLREVGLGAFRYLTLPAISVGFLQSALLARMTRSAMLDVLHQDYIRTARAKGVTSFSVVVRHALRNAGLPVLTVVGLSMGQLLGGTWIVETVYNLPGMGALAVGAILRRDYPIIQGSMIVTAGIFVMLNLVVDICYGWIDPRLRSS